MSKAERTEKTQKPADKPAIKTFLTPAEDRKRQEMFRGLIYGKKTDSTDFKAPAELIYLIVLGKIENRDIVEADLKELKRTLDCVADKISEIIVKSRCKPSENNTPR
jgi:hypothetical protein